MSASSTPSTLWLVDDQEAREEGAEHVDYGSRLSPKFSKVAFLDQDTGECGERRLNHSDGEAEKFHWDLSVRGIRVRVWMEAAEVYRS